MDIPPSRANTSERSAGSRVWCLGSFSGFSFASDRPLVIERQVCSLNTNPYVSTALHYTITVCCNRTARSQHCLPASVQTRELHLKYARATGDRTPDPSHQQLSVLMPYRTVQIVIFLSIRKPITSFGGIESLICWRRKLLARIKYGRP